MKTKYGFENIKEIIIDALFKIRIFTFVKKRVDINYKNKADSFVPTTRMPHYSSEDGARDMPKEMFLLPSFNWTWENDWAISGEVSSETEDVFYIFDFKILEIFCKIKPASNKKITLNPCY